MANDVYKRMMPCGSRAGVMYGLPKIHKTGTPVRPIVSNVKTYNYDLAKYLNETPLVDSTYILKDFVNKVSTLDPKVDCYQVSFDVESLFTNVPTIETTNMILDLVYHDNVTIFHNLNREELKTLLLICMQESHFQFQGNYYDQIDGSAMGSPFACLYANVFMSNFEKKYMSRLIALGVKRWWRYLDDIHATLDNKEQADLILAFLNSQHPNIRFTIEHEVKNKLPFLDTCVTRTSSKHITTLYRKKTFTGV